MKVLSLKVCSRPCELHQGLQAAKEIHQFHHDVDELKGWMVEKEAVLDTEEDQDLHSIQTLVKQHEALEVIQLLCLFVCFLKYIYMRALTHTHTHTF